MSGPIINGSRNAVIRSTQVNFDPVRGLIMETEYESAGDNLAGVAAILRNQNVSHTWNKNGHHSTLRATFSGGQGGLPDAQQINWQLFANEIQKDIFQSQFALDGLAIYDGLLADVRQSKALIDDEGFESAEAAAIRAAVPSGAVSYYDSLLNSLLIGQTSFATIQWVLKFSGCISNFYTGSVPSQAGANKIFTTSDILDFGLPVPIANMIDTIEAPSSVSGFTWGWRQLGGTATTNAHNRVELSTEWWLDLWNNTFYPNA